MRNTIPTLGTISWRRPLMPAAIAFGLVLVLVFAFAHRAAAQFAAARANVNPLTEGNDFLVTGNYVVAGAYGLTSHAKNGFATGTIQFPDKNPITGTTNPGITGTTFVPPGAEIVAALVYWQEEVTSTTSTIPSQDPGANGFFRPVFAGGPGTGYPITGVNLMAQNTVSFSNGGCTGSSTGKVVRTYRADVRGYLPQDANGNILVNSTDGVTFEIMLASAGQGTPVPLGATFLLVFRVLSKDFPLTAISLYEGAFAPGNTFLTMTQTVPGFYQAADNPVSSLTQIVGSTHSNKFQTVYLNDVPLTSLYGSSQPALPGWYGSWDTVRWSFPDPNNPGAGVAPGAASAKTMVVPTSSQGGCPSWGAVIVSTTVQDPDKDGLPPVWKTNQGYCDVAINPGPCGGTTDPSWVSLADPADPPKSGRQDVFIHYDHVVDSNGISYALNPQAISMVHDAFLKHNIHLHITRGGAIPDETCQDSFPAGLPPRLCAFPNQPGVVGWFAGLAFLKNQPINYPDEISCETLTPPPNGTPGSGPPCIRNFPHGEGTSFHYVLSANALGEPSWSLQDGSLTSVVATTDGKVTFTTSTPHGLIVDHNLGNGRVTIVYAITNPNLNGTYWVTGTSISNPANNAPDTFTIQIPTPVSTMTSYTHSTDWNLSVAPGLAGTSSGRSDVGGQHTITSLGSWGADGQSVLVQAGTLMHELGHSKALAHGGYKFPHAPASYVPTVGANCKSNYQSVMNYLFQVDLLDNGSLTNVVDYSGQTLDTIDKINTSHDLVIPPVSPFTITPTYLSTSWYVPFFGVGTPATVYCPGGPITNGAQMVRLTLPPSFLFWTAGQDINFDGNTTTEPPSEGVDDWDNLLDLRQVCATGCVSTAGIGTGSGLTIAGGGGGLGAAGGGSGLGWAGAGSGVSAAGGGSGVSTAGGGSGLGYGGGGSGLTLAGGGSGVGIGGAGSGVSAAGGGSGKGHEITRHQANSVTRPPRNLTASEGASPRTITLNWTQPTFGQIVKYKIYRSDAGGPFNLIGVSVPPPTPPATTFTDNPACNLGGYRYYVTAVIISDTNSEQESVPSNTVSTGQNKELLTGCYTFTGFTAPAAGSSAVQSTLVPITWSVQDFSNKSGAFVNNAAANTLVAIGPINNDAVCVAPPVNTPRTTIAQSGAGISVSAGPNFVFSFNWNTTGFAAGCYLLELDLDSGQPKAGNQPVSAFQVLIYLSDVSLMVTTPSPLPAATETVAYNTLLSESGGTLGGPVPFTWTVVSGSLPPNLSLAVAPDGMSGALSGTPTTPGTYNFTVKVTDSIGDFGTKPLTLLVNALVSTAADSGAGSLRQAILDVNAAQPGPQPISILFNIPGAGVQTISPITPLPALTQPTILDARTQPGYLGTPLIELNGTNAGNPANGLDVAGGSSTVAGLVINRFSGNGIQIDTKGGDVIQANYIGTDKTGATAAPNTGNGIQIIATANNVVGGANVISGNGGEGVRIDGTLATNNAVVSNRIGTDPTGSFAVGNSASGVYIRRAPGNSVAGNVVSGNLGFAGITICGIDPGGCGGGDVQGIDETSNAAGNAVQGNFVGTDAAGVNPLGNNQAGVSIDGAPNTQVGRAVASSGNTISNNGTNDVQIFSPAATGNQIVGNTIQGKASANTVGISEGIFASLAAGTGNTFSQNRISGHGGLGIDVAPPGVNPNATGAPNNYPAITSAHVTSGTTTITGSLNGVPNATYIIEFFSSASCNASKNGEGMNFLGAASLGLDASGNLPFGFNTGAQPVGAVITATSTDATGTTSEFSACVPVS